MVPSWQKSQVVASVVFHSVTIRVMSLPIATKKSKALTPERTRVGAILTVGLLARSEPLAAVCAFVSRNIGASFRGAGRGARWLVRGSWAWISVRPGTRPRRMARRSGLAAARYLLAKPQLARPIRWLLRRSPTIEQRFRMLLRSPADAHRATVQTVSDIPARARNVYAELKAAIAKREACV